MTDSILAAGPIGALHIVVLPSATGQLVTLAASLCGVCFLVGFSLLAWGMLEGVILFDEIVEARRVAAVQPSSGEKDPILTLDMDEPGGLLRKSNRELLSQHPDLQEKVDRILKRFGLAARLLSLSFAGFLLVVFVVALLESTG